MNDAILESNAAKHSIAMIYARSENHCIGQDGGLPWRLPNDFKHFKQTTMGHPIIMGRKTYEDHDGVLPGRLNIIVTRQLDYQVPEPAVVAHDIDSAISKGAQDNPYLFLIGGAKILEHGYQHPRLIHVYETVVHTEVAGDTFLPTFDFSDWQTEVFFEHAADEKHPFPFTVFKHTQANTD